MTLEPRTSSERSNMALALRDLALSLSAVVVLVFFGTSWALSKSLLKDRRHANISSDCVRSDLKRV
jgi:hypothetical protein